MILPPDLGSRGPNTLAETVVKPCVICAVPSAAVSLDPPSLITTDRNSYCFRPSIRNPPALSSSTLDCDLNVSSECYRKLCAVLTMIVELMKKSCQDEKT